MKKLVIIPAFNEAESIVGTVTDIVEHAPGFDYVIINDCSSDDTHAICEREHLNEVRLSMNLGIGGAVQTGYMYALEKGYDVAVQFDGDGQHDAGYLNEMVKVLERENADMVIGSRFIEKVGFQSSKARRFGIAFFTFLIRLLTGKIITDPTSGFRMCNRRAIETFVNYYPKDYPEPETVMTLLKHKMKVVEIPVIMRPRENGVSSISPRKSIYYMIKVSLAVVIERIRK